MTLGISLIISVLLLHTTVKLFLIISVQPHARPLADSTHGLGVLIHTAASFINMQPH